MSAFDVLSSRPQIGRIAGVAALLGLSALAGAQGPVAGDLRAAAALSASATSPPVGSDGRFASAYGRSVMAADRGDPAAAGVALFMFRNGQTMFGSDWSATEAQQVRWNALAVNAARFQVPVMSNGTDD